MNAPELWIAEVVARGPNGIVKVQLQLIGKPDPDMRAKLIADVTGLYRRQYSEWPTHPTERQWQRQVTA